jgi:hypothetical protein
MIFKPINVSLLNNKFIFAWIIFLFFTLIVDSSIVRIYYFGLSQSAVPWIMSLFFIIVIIFLASLYVMSNLVGKKSAEIRTRQPIINGLYKMVIISQIVLAITFLLLVFQISTISRYSVILLTAATMISYFTSMSLMGFLGYRFIIWFKSNRTPVLFFYGLACIVHTISGAFAISLVTLILRNVPTFASQHVGTGYPYFSIGSATYLVSYGYAIFTVLTFIIWWAASVLVLRHYYKEWGGQKIFSNNNPASCIFSNSI